VIYLEKLLEELFGYFYLLTGSYGVSIIFLSIGVTLLLTPFYYLTGILEHREKLMCQRLEPFIVQINQIKDSQLRHKHLQKLYKVHKYLPIYSLRSLSSLLIQIPFFIAAYEMLSHFTPLQYVAFLFIKDLGSPDEMLFGVNLLPVLMTLINFAATIFMTSGQDVKDRKQSYVIAILFLVLLYTSPAGLVLYWTCNNFINMLRYFIFWLRENNIFSAFKYTATRAKNVLYNDEAVLFLLFIVLYFSINLYSFGAYNKRESSLILTLLLIPFYISLFLKTFRYIKFNFQKSRSFIIKISLIAILFIASFVSYQYEKTHYLLAILVLLAIYQIKNIKACSFKNCLSACAMSAAIMLFPLILYLKSNAVYFVGSDSFMYCGALILFAVLLPLCAYFLNQVSINEANMFSAAFIISAMFLPLIREIVGYAGQTPIDFIILFSVALFIVKLFDKHKKIIVVFFLSAALCAAFVNIKVSSKSSVEQSLLESTVQIPQELMELEMKDDASIYLFMHDGFPRKDLAEYIGLKYDELDEIFSQNGFKVYDVYSIGYNTNVSMTSVFDIKDHRIDEDLINAQKGRRIMSGDNVVNLLLRSKGYETAIAGEDDPYSFDKRLFALGLTAGKPRMKNQVLLGLMQGRLNTMLLKHRMEGSPAMQVAEFARDNGGKNKIYAWGAAGPDHSSLSLNLSDELKTWSVKYYNAIADFKKELRTAIENNPNAIIIFMSDHGPWMLGNPRSDYIGVPDDQLSPMYFRDKYGAAMAIRWPDKVRASKYDKDFVITQDLFPIVFAYLYDSPIPLKYKIKNTVVEIRGHQFDKGKMIK
jgi:YidC/Oxa1 family membrane protein insertase